jgi:hypothetical protein
MSDQPDPAPTAGSPSVDNSAADKKPRVAISRREFARRAALASAVATIAPTAVVTAHAAPAPDSAPTSPDSAPAKPASPALAPQEPNAPKLSPESQSEADARFQSILVLYGSRFSPEQKNDLHRLCAVIQPALDHIRAYKIENGDGPALYLKPQYEREKKPKPPAAAPAPKSAPPANAAPKKP